MVNGGVKRHEKVGIRTQKGEKWHRITYKSDTSMKFKSLLLRQIKKTGIRSRMPVFSAFPMIYALICCVFHSMKFPQIRFFLNFSLS